MNFSGIGVAPRSQVNWGLLVSLERWLVPTARPALKDTGLRCLLSCAALHSLRLHGPSPIGTGGLAP
eukprot:9020954-Alexandrium_andersonii.AAC.1